LADEFIEGCPAFVLTITRSKNDAGAYAKGYDGSSVIDPRDRYDQRGNPFGHSVAFRSQAEQRRDDYGRRHGCHYRSSDTENNYYSVPVLKSEVINVFISSVKYPQSTANFHGMSSR